MKGLYIRNPSLMLKLIFIPVTHVLHGDMHRFVATHAAEHAKKHDSELLPRYISFGNEWR
jgi:hypothetical protein